VFLKNVRAVWSAVNGDVSLALLGFESLAAVSAQGLLSDQQALASGGTAAATGLDAAGIQSLLNLDPFCVKRLQTAEIQPPLVGSPRFVPASPAERAGEGTATTGDQFSVTYEITQEDKQVQTTVNTTVTDNKPGWLSVMFGLDDNTNTENTMSLTVGMTTDSKDDDKVTYTATLFSEGSDDPYDVLIFYDRLFGSMAFAPKGSPVLAGISAATSAG
jgi:hypothetical protein